MPLSLHEIKTRHAPPAYVKFYLPILFGSEFRCRKFLVSRVNEGMERIRMALDNTKIGQITGTTIRTSMRLSLCVYG